MLLDTWVITRARRGAEFNFGSKITNQIISIVPKKSILVQKVIFRLIKSQIRQRVTFVFFFPITEKNGNMILFKGFSNVVENIGIFQQGKNQKYPEKKLDRSLFRMGSKKLNFGLR